VKLRFALPVVTGAMILLAGCTSTSTPVASSSPSPAASAGASPAPSSATITGGFGDTASNPDYQNYICAENYGNYSYIIVAGPDAAKGKAYCASMEVTGTRAAGPFPAGSYKQLTASNGCWLALGSDTVRVVTAANAQQGVNTDAYTLAICHQIGVQ
jgi:hypothetical protein